MAAADERKHLATKIWRPGLMGWSYPHWTLTKRERAIIAYWDKRGHLERDGVMMRLTEAGRAALLSNGD